MSALRELLQNKRLRLFALIAFVVGCVAIVIAWKAGFNLETLKSLWSSTETFLTDHSWALFLGLVILPSLPIPMSALLLIASAVWGPTWQCCALVLLALALNLTWSYWVAAYPARNLIEKFLARTRFKIPSPSTADQVQLILLLRLTPGIPFFLHNYILGFLRPPFVLYLALSIVLSGAVAVGIVLTGGALFKGEGKMALFGAFFLVLAVLVVRLVRKRILRKTSAREDSQDSATDTAD
ncbi:MAG: VTT domain-containing protein [Verrucomicrobiae bacterium]|nr:VTT domain-containing protein [Verrucomicrobiae bacterium]